jgi:hypothetical protein
MRARVTKRVLGGRGLRKHLVGRHRLEQHAKPGAHDGVVVGQHKRDAPGIGCH